MNIIKPLQLMYKQTVIEQDRRFHCVISPAIGFRLSSGEAVLEMDAMSESIEAMGDSPLPDPGMPKPKAEFLVSGKYYAPGGEPVTGGEVRVVLGHQSKSLYVFGDREWVMGVPSEAEKMTEMPLEYSRAYGGANYPANPVGIGYDELRLPNIEHPDHLLTSAKASVPPAGLSVMDVRSEQRLKYQGTYDENYLQQYYPGYPADFDWHSFLCAAQDQWSNDYYAGNESFELHNLHPEKPLIAGRLPGYRARCFLEKEKGDSLREVSLNLDTVWFFPEKDLGMLIWRGGLDVEDDEADDLYRVMVAYEQGRDPARELEHYHQALQQIARDDDATIRQMSTLALIPEGERSAMQLLQEKTGDVDDSAFGKNLDAKAEAVSEMATSKVEEALQEMKAGIPQNDEVKLDQIDSVEDLLKKSGTESTDADVIALHQKLEKILPGITKGDPKKINFDDFSFDKIDAIMQEIEKLIDKKKEDSIQQVDKVKLELQQALESELQDMASQTDEELAKTRQTLEQIEALENPPPAPLPRIDSSAIIKELDKLTPQTMEAMQNLQTLKAMGQADESTAQLEEMIRNSLNDQDSEREQGLIEVEREFREMYLETAHFQPQGESPHAVTLEQRRQEFMDCWERKASLKGQDWSCLDLSDLQLDGIDLSDCYLEQVNFTGSSLRNANFSHAILARATLNHADCSSSDFSAANIGAVSAIDARFNECILDQAKLSKGNFRGAQFRQAQLQEVETLEVNLSGCDFSQARMAEFMFLKLQLENARFKTADLGKASFMQCELQHCDFSDAKLSHSIWADTGLQQCGFDRANMDSACFAATEPEQTPLQDVHFVDSCLDKANFQGIAMPHADLSGASLKQCNFSSADLTAANMKGAKANQTLFRKAKMTHAKMEGIDLCEGSMAKAQLSGASLVGANLFSVDFLRSTVGDTLFDASNLDNTIIQDWTPS